VPWAINGTEQLYFRGITNFDATIDALLKDHGLADAKEVRSMR
jgi:hypothetical protein